MWLWIDSGDFTVRVDLDDQGNIKSLPPILMKRYRSYFGRSKTEFINQLRYLERWRKYLVIKEYADNGNVFLHDWKGV